MEIEEQIVDHRVASEPGEVDETLSPEEQALQQAIENGGEIEEPPEPGDEDESGLEAEGAEGEEEEGQRVPLAELLKEREKGRAYKQQLDELQTKVERGEKRLEELFAKQKPTGTAPVEDPDPEPDREEDWIAWSEWKIRQQDKLIANLTQGHQNQQQASEEMRVRQHISAMEQEYAADHEDYRPKVMGLGQFFDKLLERAFPDPQRRQGYIQMLTAGIVNEQLRLGVNPAEIVYDMGQTIAALAEQAAAPEVPAAPTPKPRPTKAATRAARRSLSNVGSGEPAPSGPSYEDILNMTDEQYEAFKEKMGDDGVDSIRRDMIMGG